ncbi:MAG: HDIG domain-containing protein [Sedimentisphaerales bacterium]|nr:HDIG domain-containing protein [Sedimentisphaerales bacterium]
MAMWAKKVNPRGDRVRQDVSDERLSRLNRIATGGVPGSLLLVLIFIVGAGAILSITVGMDAIGIRSPEAIIAYMGLVTLISMAGAVYIYQYQRRVIKNNLRGFALMGLFLLLLAAIKAGMLFTRQLELSTGAAVTVAIILTIAYDQRFSLGMSLFFSMLVWLAIGQFDRMDIFFMMAAGVFPCCFLLREIRTRTKLFEVSVIAALVVFCAAGFFGILRLASKTDILFSAGAAAMMVIGVGFLIQGLLPIIEKAFHVATSMTLLDYSDASQPLLRRLHLEAPGTYSHSLLIGSLAEAAAETIGANDLLCRVGAYYHDIGKLNKPGYFIENQMGAVSRHKELSPAMSQLIIIGHVKDGIEMAKEYGLPAVLRQFIETHHGTTLIEYFYHEAKKQQQQTPGCSLPIESEFRYVGPKPKSRETAIVMLADCVEGAVRSLSEITPTRIEAVVHTMAMKRLQDGQFDECDLTLRELSKIETSLAMSLTAHYHGRIAYPQLPDVPPRYQRDSV